jgi:hypothetical protein
MPTSGMFESLAEYPRWLVIACTVLGAAVALWILVKLLKAALWILFVGAVLSAFLAALWLLLR